MIEALELNSLSVNFISPTYCYVLPLCLFACRHFHYIKNVVKISSMKRENKIPETAECVAIIKYDKTTKPSEAVRRSVSFFQYVEINQPYLIAESE